jgi:hypothetical protein
MVPEREIHMIRFAPLAVLAFLLTSPAHALLRLSPVVGLNWSSSTSDPPNPLEPQARPALGFGGLLGLDLTDGGLELELGALYKQHKVGQDDDAKLTAAGFSGVSELQASVNSLELPLVFRLTSLPVIRPGAGLYYSTYLGKGTLTFTNAAGNEVSTEVDFDSPSTQSEKTDLGALLSVQAVLPLAPTLGLLLDTRYKLGLKDTDKSSDVEKTRELEVLAGVSLEL